MRAIVMHRIGGPDVLQAEDVPAPVPAANQMLIRTEAIGMSYYETAMRAGIFPFPVPLPAVFGFEAAGTVMEVGPGADPALAGAQVVVMDMTGGAYAELLAAPAEAVTPVPDGLSAADAVAVAAQAATAACVLDQAGLVGGETVLIESAAGAVGGYLAQLARRRGVARIIGTAGGRAKLEKARERGFDEVVDHSEPGWQSRVPRGVDVVFECIGGTSARLLLDALTPGTGRMVAYGLISGDWPAVEPADLEPRGLSLVRASMAEVDGARSEVLALAARGELTPLVDSTLPLAEAAKAHQRFEDRLAAGKIILLP